MNFTKNILYQRIFYLAVDNEKTNFEVNNNKERAVKVTTGNDDNSQGFGFLANPTVK